MLVLVERKAAYHTAEAAFFPDSSAYIAGHISPKPESVGLSLSALGLGADGSRGTGALALFRSPFRLTGFPGILLLRHSVLLDLRAFGFQSLTAIS